MMTPLADARGSVFAAALLLPALLLAQSDAPGPHVATYRSAVDDSDQPYALYLPNSFTPTKQYPLVIALHEEESNHIFQLKRLFGIPGRFGESGLQALSLRTFSVPGNIDFIAACPFARGTMGYQGIAEQDVYDVLADVKRRFPIDEDRIYLTGSGMGGGGALWLALTRPGDWAAVAAVCPDTIPGSEELAPNALNLPIRLFQGELDPLVPVESTRAWHRRLLNAGAPVDYIEYPGVRHNAWDFAYKNAAIFAWLAQFRRNAAPSHIHFVTRSPRYNTAYGLRIDGFQPGQLATIDATSTGIQTHNVDAFTIHVGQASWAVMEKPVITIDATPIPIARNTALTFTRSATRWTLAHPTVAQRAVPAIPDAVSARHIYVYPTLGVQTADDLAARRHVAEQAAAWSTPRSRLNLTLAVKADNAITQDDIDTADLVLFGTSETNSLIARFALFALPIELSPAAADYGLLFIASTGKHYALISSGLPWWTGAADTHRGGYRFAPEPYRLLTTFGDYILFKGSLANVVSEGLYDSNWKIPPEAAARMLGTGTVTIH
jgi:poly(3-hydroxybutyrate) depolymerase